jgi:hypothetical protein
MPWGRRCPFGQRLEGDLRRGRGRGSHHPLLAGPRGPRLLVPVCALCAMLPWRGSLLIRCPGDNSPLLCPLARLGNTARHGSMARPGSMARLGSMARYAEVAPSAWLWRGGPFVAWRTAGGLQRCAAQRTRPCAGAAGTRGHVARRVSVPPSPLTRSVCAAAACGDSHQDTAWNAPGARSAVGVPSRGMSRCPISLIRQRLYLKQVFYSCIIPFICTMDDSTRCKGRWRHFGGDGRFGEQHDLSGEI